MAEPGGIQRYSSRRLKTLGRSYLAERLHGARSYDRIAGYFSGSIVEVAGEALESVSGTVRVICNSGLQPADVATARAAEAAIRQEWCGSAPEKAVEAAGDPLKQRLARLHALLASGKLQVRVLPDQHFGLIHGKAGVITSADGSQTAFLGSVNESKSAWMLNYELLWEDPSPEAVAWVQEEFEALWTHHAAVPLAKAVIEDIRRLSKRVVLPGLADWQKEPGGDGPEPASAFVESPVFRKQAGLWAHQKYFVKLAFDAHLHAPGGARYVLADQVGLGKTVQLAMAAVLMALTGDKPVLILAPKTLIWQWQGELLELLGAPSAVWNGQHWTDENEVEYPAIGPEGIRRCPRRLGIVPSSRATFGCADAELLKAMQFECVIVDEAHNARRKNLGEDRDDERADPNNLLAFLQVLSTRTKSLLLATATPVQLRPVEAWDLLDVLARGSDAVLGNAYSRWRQPSEALGLVMETAPLPGTDLERWQWLRTPLPPRAEHPDFANLRRSLSFDDSVVSASGDDWNRLRPPDQQRVRQGFARFVSQHNPFIRRIVRRSRSYLESTIDPSTGEPYLKPIRVELLGEGEADALRLPSYLGEAYQLAEEFCALIARRTPGGGFLKTLLLRRVGSSIAAGKATAEKMLASWRDVAAADPDEDDESGDSQSRTLEPEERRLLERFVAALEANQERDPKYAVVLACLRQRRWLERGCIVFSQYFDSIRWLADQLREDFPDEPIAIYAGSGKSGVWRDGQFVSTGREEIKQRVRIGQIRLMLGTDAASEGLNLQRLGTLINLDLPWNPTRLEQRKGRIQRIGQVNDTVYVYNLRYRGSVEDRVHQLLAERLEDIHALFGQIPDVLEHAWIDVALGQIDLARQRIDDLPRRHPFEIKYQAINNVDWESCERVLTPQASKTALRSAW